MPRYHIRIVNVADRVKEATLAINVREALIKQAPVWIDVEHPLEGIHRDTEDHSYFEFAAENLEVIDNTLEQLDCRNSIELTETDALLGDPCEWCGNIAGPVRPAVCPNCEFKDIAPCPVCGQRHPRQNYENIRGNLYYCPSRRNGSRHRVRMCFNDPIFLPDGSLNEPLVLVSDAAEVIRRI